MGNLHATSVDAAAAQLQTYMNPKSSQVVHEWSMISWMHDVGSHEPLREPETAPAVAATVACDIIPKHINFVTQSNLYNYI